MKRLIVWICVIAFLALMGIVAFFAVRKLAYARVERLTELYTHEFSAVIQEISAEYGRLGDESIDYYKVFHYTPDEAKLFVVLRYKNGNRNGFYVYMRRQSGEWQIIDYEFVWSQHGSTDGSTWPPYW